MTGQDRQDRREGQDGQERPPTSFQSRGRLSLLHISRPAAPHMLLLDRVRQFVRQHALFDGDTRVIAAVSGGSDSVALALLLRDLTAAGAVRLAAVAHFNHQLRGEADRDEACAADVARAIGVPFVAGREDVRARARLEQQSLEVAARDARYAFFERTREACRADLVALGHTRDDQAETVLLRLVRGTGLRGLAGMYPRRGPFVRPLLECRRAELRAYLDDRHTAYVDDETNGDVSIPRNRVRAELLPLLTERFNPGIVDALAREAELARETWAWLEQEAARFEQASTPPALPAFPARPAHPALPAPPAFPAPPALELDLERLGQASPPLRRLVLWRAMTSLANGRPVSFSHVDAALALLDADGTAVDAPGQRVQRLGARLVLTGRAERAVGRSKGPSRAASSMRYRFRGRLRWSRLVARFPWRLRRLGSIEPGRNARGLGSRPLSGRTVARPLWRSGTGALGTVSVPSASAVGRSSRITSSIGR